MSKTANLYVRIEPDLKEQAEQILSNQLLLLRAARLNSLLMR